MDLASILKSLSGTSNAMLSFPNGISIEYDGSNATIKGRPEDLIGSFVPVSMDNGTLAPQTAQQSPRSENPVRGNRGCPTYIGLISHRGVLPVDTENPHPSFLMLNEKRLDGAYILKHAPTSGRLYTAMDYTDALHMTEQVFYSSIRYRCIKYLWNNIAYLDISEVDYVLHDGKFRQLNLDRFEKLVQKAPEYQEPEVIGFCPNSDPKDPWLMQKADIAMIIGIRPNSFQVSIRGHSDNRSPSMFDIRTIPKLRYDASDPKTGGRRMIRFAEGEENLRKCIDEIAAYCERHGYDSRKTLD